MHALVRACGFLVRTYASLTRSTIVVLVPAEKHRYASPQDVQPRPLLLQRCRHGAPPFAPRFLPRRDCAVLAAAATARVHLRDRARWIVMRGDKAGGGGGEEQDEAEEAQSLATPAIPVSSPRLLSSPLAACPIRLPSSRSHTAAMDPHRDPPPY